MHPSRQPPPSRDALATTQRRLVQLNGAVVAVVTPAKKDLTVTIAKSHQVYLIQYSATTIYYGSHLRNIHVGTKVTGSLVGTTMTAQGISTKVVTRTSTATSGIASPNFGASGPCVGNKYVGNVERFFSGTRGVANLGCRASLTRIGSLARSGRDYPWHSSTLFGARAAT